MRKICRGQDSNDLDAIINNIILLVRSAVFRNVSRRGKTEVPSNKGGRAWNPTVLSDLCNINWYKAWWIPKGGGGRKKQGGRMPPAP